MIRLVFWRNFAKRGHVFVSLREAIRRGIEMEQEGWAAKCFVEVDGKKAISNEQLHAIERRLWLVRRHSNDRKWLEAQQEVFGA